MLDKKKNYRSFIKMNASGGETTNRNGNHHAQVTDISWATFLLIETIMTTRAARTGRAHSLIAHLLIANNTVSSE